MVVSFWNHQFTHVPISLAVSERKKIDPDGIALEQRSRLDRSAAGYVLSATDPRRAHGLFATCLARTTTERGPAAYKR